MFKILQSYFNTNIISEEYTDLGWYYFFNHGEYNIHICRHFEGDATGIIFKEKKCVSSISRPFYLTLKAIKKVIGL